jgi:hypothetical protein
MANADPKAGGKAAIPAAAHRNRRPPSGRGFNQAYWDALLRDPRAAGKPWAPIEQMRLSQIPREMLRVECARCSRCVEIQRLDAIKLYGQHAIWRDVGQVLLDDGCQVRTGRHEEDGCWPDWTR